MKKLILSVIMVLALAITALASDTNGLFQANEFSLSLGSGYSLNTSKVKATKDVFQAPYSLNFNAGAEYFLTRHFGAEVNVPFFQSRGIAVQEFQAGLLFRLPLAKTTPIFKNISPYVGVGGIYNWQQPVNWAYVGKAGIEFRLNPYWGIFAEGQYRNVDFTWDKGNTSINGGLRLVF
jgi:opacity protein-like surface antigen